MRLSGGGLKLAPPPLLFQYKPLHMVRLHPLILFSLFSLQKKLPMVLFIGL
jgi:hypothetical protein